jgi:cytoskeletal protein RodZ
MEIGRELKEAREALGLSLEAVEQETKIRRKYLQALEKEQFDLLPGEVYAKAFLKNYARFLNLDVGEVVDAYDRTFTRAEIPERSAAPKRAEEPVKVRGLGKPRYWLYFAAFVVLIGLAISLFYGARGLGLLPPADRTREEVRREPAQTPLQTGEQTQTPEGQTQAPGQQAEPDQTTGVNLVLNVKSDRSWMRVIVDGNPAFQGEVPAGQSKNFKATDKIAVTLGNAGVVEVLLNEQNLGYLGGKDAVVYREFIPPRG